MARKQKTSLLMVHAQDHLMTSLLARDLIEEMIGMLKEKSEKISNQKKAGGKKHENIACLCRRLLNDNDDGVNEKSCQRIKKLR